MIDVLIAGAGPAGLATALNLARDRPKLRVVVLEKARHPRPKTCAGGLIPKTILALRALDLRLEVPAVEVVRGVARTELGDVDLTREGATLCTVVRREEFDASLAAAARARGVEIVERCPLMELRQERESVSAITPRGIFTARAMVGADGSGSRVRALVAASPRDRGFLGRALMTDVPVDPRSAPEFVRRAYRFDFRCVERGVRGYAWSFPCIIDGRAHLNLGIYDQRPRMCAAPGGEHALMLEELRAAFPEVGPELGKRAGTFRAFPIRWYDATDRLAMGRIILAGDAAGVDPLMGEGISCAFEHGRLAAAHLGRFLSGGSAALDDYGRELHRGSVGRKLRKLVFAANGFYGRHHRWYFRAARLSRGAREIGVDWYNGAAHTDELPTRRLIARWARALIGRKF